MTDALLLAVSGALVLQLAGGVAPNGADRVRIEEQLIEGLKSASLDARFQAAQRLATIGATTAASTSQIFALAATGETGSWLVERNSSRWLAIGLLGQLRLHTSWLIDNIELHDPDYRLAGQTQEFLTFEYYFPCAKALLAMGEDAIPAVTKGFLSVGDEQKRDILGLTLRSFDSPKVLRKSMLDLVPTESKALALAADIERMQPAHLPPVRDRKDGPIVVPVVREPRPLPEVN
jgi:hypothetical protein